MAFEDFDTLIAHYKLDSDGWDSGNSRLTDFSGFGNHLAIVNAASPAYQTRDGLECIDFDNTYYFEGPCYWPPYWSAVIVAVANLPGSEGITYPLAFAENKNVADNHDDAANQLSDAEFLTITYLRKALRHYTNAPQIFDRIGTAAFGAAWTPGAMDIATCGVLRDPHQVQIATQDQTPVTSAYTTAVTHSSGVQSGQFLRLGQLKGALGALGAGNYYSGKRLYVFHGDVFSHPDYAVALATEMTAYGI